MTRPGPGRGRPAAASLLAGVLLVATLAAADEPPAGTPDAAASPAEPAAQARPALPATPVTAPAATAAPAGSARLIVEDLRPGVGAVARPGMLVAVHYTGWLYDPAAPDHRGRKFDSSLDHGRPLVFPLGAGRVIRGWDEGVPGMQIGGLRRLVIPPEFAYGDRELGKGLIPARSTLLFEVELLGVEAMTEAQQK